MGNRWYVWKWKRGEKGIEYCVVDKLKKGIIVRRRKHHEAQKIAEAFNICLN